MKRVKINNQKTPMTVGGKSGGLEEEKKKANSFMRRWLLNS